MSETFTIKVTEIMNATCRECARVFDLTDDDDSAEWSFGHDCEG